MTTFSDDSSVDEQIENVYAQATDLFDPGTVLDIDNDEYARGVVELVTRLLGMDDKEDVADIITEKLKRPVPEDKDITWTDLELRPNGEFYIERLKASTSEYWPFRVERYDDMGAWRLIDGTSDVPMAIIRPGTQHESWRVTVNGYAQVKPFTNLKAAVIYAVGEFNG